MELFAADSLSPLISPLRDAAMRADRLIVAVLRRVLEVVLRETGLTPLPDELREGFGFLPLPLSRPLCIS
jgi:hypothetical protein